MQFYIIHKDPKTNASALPDYALQKVNIREGYQMLSDIGHANNNHWSGQNKEYNRYHPNTWRFWKTKAEYVYFLKHYAMCLDEYIIRFGKTTKFHTLFANHFFEILNTYHKIKDMTEEEATINYVLKRKDKFLTEEEKNKLKII